VKLAGVPKRGRGGGEWRGDGKRLEVEGRGISRGRREGKDRGKEGSGGERITLRMRSILN